MARTARSHLQSWTPWCAALFICTLLSRGQARFLAEQKGVSLRAVESHPGGTGGTDLGSQTESRPILITGSTSMSPFYWFHRKLAVFAALERAVLQRTSQSLVKSEIDSSVIQKELLRHVGCARLRAALLNKAAHQVAEFGTGSSDSTASTLDSSSGGYVPNVMDDTGEEYFEDYGALRVSSRSTYNGGVASGDTDVAALGGSGAESALTVTRSLRSQSSEGYYSGYYGSAYEEELEKTMEELWEGGDWDDLYEEEAEYEYSDEEFEFQYDDYYLEDADDEEVKGEEQETKDFESERLPVMQRGIRPLKTMSLRQQYGIEGRALKLLEDANEMAFGRKQVQNQDSSAASTSLATDSSLLATADSVTPFLVNAPVAGSDFWSREQAEVDESGATSFFYEPYSPYDQTDTIGRIGGPGGDDLYFGYEYDMYDDYFQAMTLADMMLGKLDMNAGDDQWADYLEQAYEYFTVYVDDGLNEYDFIKDEYDTTALDASSAVVALASIAEMVILAHMGNFVLEARPGFTVAQVSKDGVVIESGRIVLITDELYSGSGGSYVSALYGMEAGQAGVEPLLLSQQQPDVEVVNDISMRLVLRDGSVNWGLVTMMILTAGSLAMLVGFVASWLSLRRSMALSSGGWVYVPPKRSGNGVSYGGDFSGKGGKGGFPFLLRPDDVKGAVCWAATPGSMVEDASQYVPLKAENESVSKALHK